MRHSNLAAVLFLGVGMFTTTTSAQQLQQLQQMQPPTAAPADKATQETLSRRARAALEAALALKAAQAGGFPFKGDDRRFELQGDVDHLRAPVDCAMPVIKGDPAIDPQFSKQPMAPPGKSFWHMKVIPVEPCPH